MSGSLRNQKVVFAGLDNGGKSTIISFLEDRLTLCLNKKILPTLRAKQSVHDVKLFGLSLFVWDLGGQEQYRVQYFDDQDKFFTDLPLLIYVIDLTDTKRYDLALDYLTKIMHILKENNEDTNIFVLFHKLDPKLEDKELHDKYAEELTHRILNLKLSDNISFYNTSIFNGMSIIRAFSDAVTSISGEPKIIQELLKEYCVKSMSCAATLFDTRFLIVDGTATDEIYIDLIKTASNFLAMTLENLQAHQIDAVDMVTRVMLPPTLSHSREGFIFIQRIFPKENLYLISLALDERMKVISQKYFNALVDKLQEVLITP